MTNAEFERQMTAALLDALMGDARLTEETREAMMANVIKLIPLTETVKWVESVKIENGVVSAEFTPEAKELLRQQGWGKIDAPQPTGD